MRFFTTFFFLSIFLLCSAQAGIRCETSDGADIKADVILDQESKLPVIKDGSFVRVQLQENPMVGFANYTFEKDSNSDREEFSNVWVSDDKISIEGRAEAKNDADGKPMRAVVILRFLIETSFDEELGAYKGTFKFTQQSKIRENITFQDIVDGAINCYNDG